MAPAEGIKTPRSHDVLLGRGAGVYNHHGNAVLRLVVERNKPLYATCTPNYKSAFAQSIVEAVWRQEPPGRFLEKSKADGLWYEVDFKAAIKKTQQCLREPAKKSSGKTGAEYDERQMSKSNGLLRDMTRLFTVAMRAEASKTLKDDASATSFAAEPKAEMSELPIMQNEPGACAKEEHSVRTIQGRIVSPPLPNGASKAQKGDRDTPTVSMVTDSTLNSQKMLPLIGDQKLSPFALTTNKSAQNYFRGIINQSSCGWSIPHKLKHLTPSMKASSKLGKNENQGPAQEELSSVSNHLEPADGVPSEAPSNLNEKSTPRKYGQKVSHSDSSADSTSSEAPKLAAGIPTLEAAASGMLDPVSLLSQISVMSFAISEESLTREALAALSNDTLDSSDTLMLLGSSVSPVMGDSENEMSLMEERLGIDATLCGPKRSKERQLSLLGDFDDTPIMARLRSC